MQAEVAACIKAFADQLDENGHRLVVRNGFHEPREVITAAGAVPVRQPQVNDKRTDEVSGKRKRFASAILPAWARKSPKVAEVLPLLYLHGLSSGDFGPALEQFLGSTADLSASTITRLTTQWQDEAIAFNKRSLAATDYVYVWGDGIHLKVRLEQDKVCLLVMIGVRADGTKELVALDDGHRESTESWADLLRSYKPRDARPGARGRRRGNRVLGRGPHRVPRNPRTAVLVPQDRQRPQRAPEVRAAERQGRAGGDLERREPRPRREGGQGVRRRLRHQVAQGVARITDDLDVLLTFCNYPVEHWIHLRTTNLIESTFATLRLRQRVTKGPGSRAAGIAMAFKLIESAPARWRAVNAPQLVALVRAGATFNNGVLVERADDPAVASGDDQQVA